MSWGCGKPWNVSGGPAGGGGGGVTSGLIRFAFGPAGASSGTALLAGAVVVRCYVSITTPFDVGATVQVGIAANHTLFQSSAQNDPQVADLYDNPQDTTGGAGNPILVSVGGAPTVGAGIAAVEWYVPES